MRLFTSVCLVLLAFALPAQAVDVGHFWVGLEGDHHNWNQLNPSLSGGDGYQRPGVDGPWYYYPAPPGTIQEDPWFGMTQNPVPSWHNQWWYDGVYDPQRWKVVTLNFTYKLLNPDANGGAGILINYSKPAWSLLEPHPAGPPLPGDDNPPETYIGRIMVENNDTWILAGDPTVHTFSKSFDLRAYGVDFNPEWVSLDVFGYNILLSSPDNPGSIIHECVPEPGTWAMLVCGGLAGLIYTGWRRKR